MQNSFDTLVQSYIDTNVGIADDFLSLPLARLLKENLLLHFTENDFVAAGMGNNTLVTHNTAVRSDLIYWLDRKHDNVSENSFIMHCMKKIVFIKNISTNFKTIKTGPFL